MNWTPRQGDIVWVQILDPADQNPKTRRAVVLTRSNEITLGGQIVVAAITTKFSTSDGNAIPVPWQRGGHPITSLTSPSAAKCDWLKIVAVSEVTRAGQMPGKNLHEILSRIQQLRQN